jgi:hypothetical protein
MSSLSNPSCVDYTLNNLFAFLDYLHSCKMQFLFIYNKSINVGYTLFSVISQDIVKSNLMLKKCTS